MIPSITIFVRHAADCPHQGDEFYKRCNCRKHLRWTSDGRQCRRTAKSRSWQQAERAKRELEMQFDAAESKRPIEPNLATTVEQAIEAFLAEKTGGMKSKNTIGKYRLTLQRFQDFCTARGILFLREVTLEHLSGWRAGWTSFYQSQFALRNHQSRMRAFFNYCQKARMIDYNPARGLSAIAIRDEDYKVDPFTEAEVKKAIDMAGKISNVTPVNRERVKALMQLQRWSGLSLVDAVCLQRSELISGGKNYRIDTSRRKTGTKVQVPIPGSLGKSLLKMKNGNQQFFFWSGKSTPKSAVSVYDKLYRKVFEAAGVKDGTSHRFRHRFAVAALESGVDIRVVSRALGHKSLQTTERFYGRWNTKQQAALEKQLAATWVKPASR